VILLKSLDAGHLDTIGGDPMVTGPVGELRGRIAWAIARVIAGAFACRI